MNEAKKRLTDDEVLDAWGAIRLCHPACPRTRADHLQTRDDRRRLVTKLREILVSVDLREYQIADIKALLSEVEL